MKVLKQIDDNTRIVQKKHFIYGWMICYQIKKWYGYKTIHWLFTDQRKTIDGYQDYFEAKIETEIGTRKQF